MDAAVANYLAVPDLPTDAKATQFDLPGGLIMNGNLASVQPITNWRDESFRAAVAEDVTHAWYRGEGAQTPWKGETDPNYTDFHEDGKYTWVKRRATTVLRSKSVRWRMCWSATPPAIPSHANGRTPLQDNFLRARFQDDAGRSAIDHGALSRPRNPFRHALRPRVAALAIAHR